ncbi:MAG: hypothetical protein H6850_01070 [Alphaproteobacteria bacterium]|nr:MAG: hypothetical protein H6850_01070 [Alphaproteobacteria bacterium]
MHNSSELEHHTDFDLESFRFFGSVQFYTLFLLVTFLAGQTKFANELAILLAVSSIILLLLKVIILAITDYDIDMPSITTGLATIFFIMIITKNTSPVYIILASLTLLTVHVLAFFDSYLGSASKSFVHVFTGTAFGAALALTYKFAIQPKIYK